MSAFEKPTSLEASSSAAVSNARRLKSFFFRSRSLPLPSVASMLAIVVVFTVVFTFAATNLAYFLSPIQLVNARVAMVEGWMSPPRLDEIYDKLNAGDYELIIATGGKIESSFHQESVETYAERTRDYLIGRGVDPSNIIALPAPVARVNRTYFSATFVREWLQEHNIQINALNLYSAYCHSRRTRYLYRQAFAGQNVEMGIYAALKGRHKLAGWWKQSGSAKIVVSEVAGLVKAAFFFDPSVIESNANFDFAVIKEINDVDNLAILRASDESEPST